MSRLNATMKTLAVLSSVLLGVAADGPTATAGEAAGGGASGWQFEVAPYLWLPEVHGTATVRDRSADFDVGLDDVFDLLGDGDLFGAMGHFEARRDRLAFFVDAVGTIVDTDAKGQIARQTIKADLDLDLALVELGAAYRVLERDRFQLEALAGARYTYAYTEVTVDVADRRRSQDASQEFVDPFIGGRGAIRLAEQWALVFRGDVGGFGAGSELAWMVLGGVWWDTPWTIGAARTSMFLGYKVYDVDYESGAGGGKRDLDVQLRGPAIGAIFTF